MPFSGLQWGAQGSRRSTALPFERRIGGGLGSAIGGSGIPGVGSAPPQLPMAVPVSSAALKARRRADKAARKARRATARRARRDRLRGTGKRRGARTNTARTVAPAPPSGSPHGIRGHEKNTALSCYDTKRSPIAKAKRQPANHSYWGDVEHRFTVPSELILKQSKREAEKIKSSASSASRAAAQESTARTKLTVKGAPVDHKASAGSPDVDPDIPTFGRPWTPL